MNYRIGLDIGIASVGWSVLENNEDDEPVRIVKLGVRCFEKAEQPKTGEALAAPRRDARGTRRRLRRRRHRMERIKFLISNEWDLSMEEFIQRYYSKNLPDVYELRYKALDEKLSKEEFAQILLHIAKHRGFKSNRKSELTEDAENGKVLKAIKHNKEVFEEKGYRTIGEMMFLDDYFKETLPQRTEDEIVNNQSFQRISTRNKSGDYRFTVLRSMLEDEVKTVFECQRKLGNELATEAFEQKYVTIFLGQRSFDLGPGNQADGTPSPYGGNLIENMVGHCTFERDEQRAPKASYTFERFMVLQKVNHMKIMDKDRNVRSLSEEERDAIIELCYTQKTVKYTSIRKKIHLQEMNLFKDLNYGNSTVAAVEKANFISLNFYHDMKKSLGFENKLTAEQIERLDSIGEILTKYKSDDGRREKLEELKLNSTVIEEQLLPLNYSKFGHLSFKAIKKILPYLETGLLYNEACEHAGYEFRGETNAEKTDTISGEILTEVLADIPNPVVKRSVSQSFKVLNAIVREYGAPQEVCVELAREMAKNFAERKKIETDNKKNRDLNAKVVEQIKEYGKKHPTGLDIVKFKLWQEQQETCLYSGKHISIDHLFEKGYVDVDHIIPYSRSFDDRYVNKVLVLASENRMKGNKTPFEYFGNNESRWDEYVALVNSIVRNYRKKNYLLMAHPLTEEDEAGFKERNLTDTKYITRVVYNVIRNNLKLAPLSRPDKVKQVYAVNGSVTSYLRRCWGLNKDRDENDLHHCMDATVVACCTDGMIHKISRFMKMRERLFLRNNEYVDRESGEVLTRQQFTDRFGWQIEEPWPHFKDELTMRMAPNVEFYKNDLLKLGYPRNERIAPIFVSRMPHHKINGAAHADTIRSPKHFNDEEVKPYVVSKVSLESLKIDKKTGEIAGYYNPESDRLLYEVLKEQLLAFGGDGKKAFAEPFYKPKADGTPGPLVRKVKVIDPLSIGVPVNAGKGVAGNANGAMIRIDVFCENEKYYYVPVYVADTVKNVLPLKAATAGKAYKDWRVMKEENFIFSLYPRDLFICKHKTGIKVKKNDKGITAVNEVPLYFSSACISTASISGIAHDNTYIFESLGINSLLLLKKLQVDVLGNISEVHKEKRMPFRRKK